MATYSFLLVVILAMCLNIADPSSIYVDNDYGQTVSAGSIDDRQKQELRQEVLRWLGVHRRQDTTPNKDSIQSALEFMLILYQFSVDSRIHIKKDINATALGLDPAKVEGADVIVSLANNVQRASELRWQHAMTFYFGVSAGKQINVAELRIFKEISPAFAQGSFAINLYVIKPGLDRRDRSLDLNTSLKVEWNTTGWLTVNATKAATTWTTSPHLNMGMYLRVVDSQGRMRDPQDVGIVGRKGPAFKQPFLVVYITSKEPVSILQALGMNRWKDGVDKLYA